MPTRETVIENEHFRVERLADGLFAVLNTPEGGGMSNAGIVDLGAETLVFDAMLTRAAAADLRAAAVELTGRVPRYLVISHGHGDHTLGSCEFLPEAVVLSSAATAAMIVAEDRASIAPEALRGFIERLEEAARTEADAVVRSAIMADVYARTWQLAELPIVIVPPVLTFGDRVRIRGAKRSVELLALDKAHTAGDVYLNCSEDGVLFLGDLGFFAETPPFIAPEGDPESWSRTLTDIEAFDVEHFVPGHGPIGGIDCLRRERAFLDTAVGIARRVVAAGGTIEDAIDEMRRTEYSGWAGMDLVKVSLQSALQRVQGGTE